MSAPELFGKRERAEGFYCVARQPLIHSICVARQPLIHLCREADEEPLTMNEFSGTYRNQYVRY